MSYTTVHLYCSFLLSKFKSVHENLAVLIDYFKPPTFINAVYCKFHVCYGTTWNSLDRRVSMMTKTEICNPLASATISYSETDEIPKFLFPLLALKCCEKNSTTCIFQIWKSTMKSMIKLKMLSTDAAIYGGKKSECFIKPKSSPIPKVNFAYFRTNTLT